MVDRLVWDQEYVGSNPTILTKAGERDGNSTGSYPVELGSIPKSAKNKKYLK